MTRCDFCSRSIVRDGLTNSCGHENSIFCEDAINKMIEFELKKAKETGHSKKEKENE